MARTKNISVADMVDGQIADGTEIRIHVFSDLYVNERASAYAAWLVWSDYVADIAAWVAANPGVNPPKEVPEVPHCAVADPDNPTMPEKSFVQVRMMKRDEDDPTAPLEKEDPSEWRQSQTTNYPTVTSGFLGGGKKIFNAERTRKNLDPTP